VSLVAFLITILGVKAEISKDAVIGNNVLVGAGIKVTGAVQDNVVIFDGGRRSLTATSIQSIYGINQKHADYLRDSLPLYHNM
jgi:carbonic anhydrase/acetyltransferase-like protein (isoleucine patch superfamily)